MYQYLTIRQTLLSNELGIYKTFGINVVNRTGETVFTIPDVSPSREFAENLCRICYENQLSPIHLINIIEDFI